MKIKISTLMAFFIFHITMINCEYIFAYKYITYAFSVILFLFFLKTLSGEMYIFEKKYQKINFLICLYVVVVIFSSLRSHLNVQRGIYYSLKIIYMFIFWEYIHNKKKENDVLKVFEKLSLVYLIINDFIMFMIPNLYIKYNQEYFIGNKFNVTYLHLFYLVLFLYNHYNDRRGILKIGIKFYILLSISFIVTVYMKCATGMICNILLLLFIMLDVNERKLKEPKNLFTVIIVSCTVLLLFSNILNYSFIRYIIVDVLKKSITLTGRTNIYMKVPELIKEKIWFGYGYNNSYDIFMSLFNFPNAQNGILHLIFEEGIVGTVLLLMIIYKSLNMYNTDMKYKYMFIYLYILSVLAMVEITISIYFLMIVAMINCGVNIKEDKNK